MCSCEERDNKVEAMKFGVESVVGPLTVLLLNANSLKGEGTETDCWCEAVTYIFSSAAR